ncbi:ACBP-domain-containing protein [Lepidopterella palustris CBS 459.81]|uniref:ACBP-domain-containing protein n=1 Tax=Lepidopterella palustris CBS 459.81 TaxID=1314670 RepID=A0A8E2EKY2_9PEZI|nr:ACBP-domain-containing protein [Lepidopterella palustris CBS 459.81]
MAEASRSPALQKAWDSALTLAKAPSNEEKLDMYAYGKIADQKDINGTAKPGMFDMVGKAKYNHWKKLVDEGVTPEQAEAKYIELVETLKGKYGTK